MHSISVFGLGLALTLGGLALGAFTFRPAAQSTKPGAPLKRSQLRELEADQAVRQTETTKLRIAAAVCVVAGATVMILS